MGQPAQQHTDAHTHTQCTHCVPGVEPVCVFTEDRSNLQSGCWHVSCLWASIALISPFEELNQENSDGLGLGDVD